MKRRERIKLVAGLTVTIAGLLVAYFGAPVIARLFASTTPALNTDESMFVDFGYAMQYEMISGRISSSALLVSLVAFVYALSLLAVWFIQSAPAETSE